MRDDQTGSVWTHFDGTVLTGPLADRGVRMELRPLIHTTWEEWLELHPETLVPIWNTGFEDNYRELEPGGSGLSRRFQSTLLNTDDRLDENELVVGAGIGEDFRAYVLSDFGGSLTAVPDVLAGHPIVVVMDPASDFGIAFSAVVGDDILDFSVVDGTLVDAAGTTWDVGGGATSGPLEGTQLQFVTSFVTEWYGWAAYYPSTEIHGR